MDRTTWAIPSDKGEVADAVSIMLSAVEGETDPARVALITRLVHRRGYTRAELYYAVDEVPFRNHYGKTFRLDVLDAAVKEHREMRARITQTMNLQQVQDLCTAFPEIQAEHFHVATFDQHNNELFKYAPHLPPAKVPATPLLDEKEAPKRLGQGSGGQVDPQAALRSLRKEGGAR